MTDRVRRNGQLSSCEPCRRSKLRCDHSRPHCARCIKRKLENQCVYHPAPMAQRKRPSTDILLTTMSACDTDTPITNSTPVHSSSPPLEEAEIFSRDGTGLVSMYSSSTPYSPSSCDSRAWASLNKTGLCAVRPRFFPRPSHLQEGAEILKFIIDFSSELDDDMREHHMSTINAATYTTPIAKAAWKATYSTLQPLSGCTGEELQTRAKQIFDQTMRPLEFPQSPENDAFAISLSGDNLRWETIGLHCGLIGAFAAVRKVAYTRIFYENPQSKLRRNETILQAFQNCMTCLNFCEKCDAVNDLSLWMILVLTNISTWCFGDDSYRSWSLQGKLASDIIALGFHKGFRHDTTSPLYLKELRKRLVSFAYENSSLSATFVGRPPQFHRSYFVLDLPFDVPNDVLMGRPENLQKEIAQLDSGGWSKGAKINPVLRSRASLLHGPIREEVLELTFGSPVPDMTQRVHQIQSKLAGAWASIPPNKKYNFSDWDNEELRGTVSMLMCTKLEFLYTEFLLYKLLLNHNRAKLIEKSHEIVRIALTALKKGKNLVEELIDMEWITTSFALPCASILILELFRQNRQPQEPVTLNRSTIIQDISVLISLCDWLTESEQSNHHIIKQAQTVFSRCLDQVLNHPMPPSQPVNVQVTPWQPTHVSPADPMHFAAAELFPQDPEFCAWLESFDLQVDPWLELSENSLTG